MRKKILILIATILILGIATLIVARSNSLPAPSLSTTSQPPAQQQLARSRNLSLQPEAFNLARRLGSRFDARKRETSTLAGVLTVNSEQRDFQQQWHSAHSGYQRKQH
jgi:hypothetical protein